MHSATFRGYAELDKDVTAVVKTEAQVVDAQESQTFTTAFAGPPSESYEASDVVDQPVFSAIPGDSVVLTLHTQVRVDNSKNRKGSGMLTTGFTTHKVTAAYGLKWQS
ncbi:hypothetical protein GCM10022267_20960 [Lentzea roselyniae]|uniref:Uncharacterized protein n=1 Tax=Lentzea roselyniae TaxID=531940 RepID=A0ABP7AJC8_9PSEU